MSYQHDRDEFIAIMAREGLPLHIARKLLAGATTLQRYAELSCSSEAADRDRVPCPAGTSGPCLCDDYPAGSHAAGIHSDVPRIAVREWNLTARLRLALPNRWAICTQGDPRGCVLRVIPPSYHAENAQRPIHDPRAIGVPSGPTGLRF